MMTKVRGGKGFDALFSRFFDEPGLKAAVDSLHDNFSSTEADPPAETPAAPTAPVAARRAPVVAPAATKKPAAVATKKQVVAPAAAPATTKKTVVAPVVAVKPPVKSKATAPKKETAPDELHQEQPQDLTPDQLESISSDLTVPYSGGVVSITPIARVKLDSSQPRV